MSRKFIVTIHLYLAAFFSPIVIIMALSGGLYLLDYEGEVVRSDVGHVTGARLDANSRTLKSDVVAILATLDIDARVEEVRVRGTNFYTRPSNRQNYTLRQNESGVDVEVANPNLQAMMMELHKGHGPKIYVLLETVFAVGLMLIMLSGMYLGWMSAAYKQKTILLSAAGLLVFAVAVLL